MWPMRSARQLLYPIRLVAAHTTEPLLQAPAKSSFLFHSEAQIDGDSSDAELLRTSHQVSETSELSLLLATYCYHIIDLVPALIGQLLVVR